MASSSSWSEGRRPLCSRAVVISSRRKEASCALAKLRWCCVAPWRSDTPLTRGSCRGALLREEAKCLFDHIYAACASLARGYPVFRRAHTAPTRVGLPNHRAPVQKIPRRHRASCLCRFWLWVISSMSNIFKQRLVGLIIGPPLENGLDILLHASSRRCGVDSAPD